MELSIINIVILLAIAFFTLLQISLLGKYLTTTQFFFKNNIFGRYLIGAVSYFLISFIVLLPFIWLELSVTYKMIFFLIKDFFIFLFLILKWNKYNTKSDWKRIIYFCVGTLGVFIFYTFAMKNIFPNINFTGNKNNIKFNIINKISFLTHEYSNVGSNSIHKWLFGLIGSTIIFSSINSALIDLIRKKNILISLLSFMISISSLFLINFNLSIIEISSFYLILFGWILGIKLINQSRRRFGFFIGVVIIVSWAINQNILFLIIALSISIFIAYIFIGRPKAGIFWIQLFVPLTTLISLQLYEHYLLISILLFSFSVILYLAILMIGYIKISNKFSIIFEKGKLIIPIGFFIGIIIGGSIKLSQNSNIEKLNWFSNTLFNGLGISTKIAQWIEISIWIIIFIALLTKIVFIFKMNKRFKKNEIALISIFTLFLFFFNPLWNGMLFENELLHNQFKYIKTIVVLSLFILTTSSLVKFVSKRKNYSLTSM